MRTKARKAAGVRYSFNAASCSIAMTAFDTYWSSRWACRTGKGSEACVQSANTQEGLRALQRRHHCLGAWVSGRSSHLSTGQALGLEVLDDFLAARQGAVDAKPLLVRNLAKLQLKRRQPTQPCTT